MDNSIIYIATTPQQAFRIQEVLKKMQLSFPIYNAYGNDAVAIAKQMVNQNHTRVIVSRGGTVDRLRKNLNVPVIDIRHSFIDIYLSMERALKISDRIAIVGYPNMCAEAMRYKKIMGKSVEIVAVTSDAEFEDAIIALKARGIELIIGGMQAISAAQRHGMLFVPGDADENAITYATHEALTMLRIENERLEQYQAIQAILNYTIEGILQVDANGNIIHINNNARQLLGHDKDSIVDTQLERWAVNTLNNGSIYVNQLIELNGIPIILNCIPITVKSSTVGAIITLQREEDIITLDHKIRHKNAERGYVAKKNFSDIVSCSDSMDKLKQKAMQYARSDSTIAIYGETGTGKEVLAQSIHNHSPRARNPFVAINCAALPESILESELFGYASGAFTGARREGRAGIFELAHRGTVFLDEISELSTNVQAKFLRVIQEKEISRIGDDRIIPVDVRIIVASNKRLSDVVKNGTFRADLYYRLSVLELELPPLRERRDDIPLLVKYFLAERGLTNTVSFTQDALDLLCIQSWHGNVRELSNIVERILAISHGSTITSQEVVEAIGHSIEQESFLSPCHEDKSKSGPLDEVQKQMVVRALNQAHGNRTKAAEILSISTATLWRKMKKYNLL
ncbi:MULTISPECIES: sigma 54-interacting transcriptional regulator [Tepidanaerobacter]|uniref:sigma 54-interacting transcriptional regulator n=1 Tax=Tepidanaerobacter TaxID=499228 RepID=UPI0017771577|nr:MULTISPECIES: sigma 54-interacting transcriptional regulator [Tepidanaerobacter]GLI51662.1 sigma-54-dependent Fis family transcriptional regulator [Tepidanaerobacter syntrophicus]HHV84162.1 sigma 54-interacting transcriptional regulator [Tepidanaerobacter syntrophicus]